jgi:hypothetical protein
MQVLETPRLVLRWVTTDDAPFIFELLNEPSFLQYIGDKGVRSLEDARNQSLARWRATSVSASACTWSAQGERTPIGCAGC